MGRPLRERRLKKRSFLVSWDREGVVVGGDLSFYLTEGVCTDSPRAPLPKRRDVVANAAGSHRFMVIISGGVQIIYYWP